MKNLVIFDVDGTLTRGDGLGTRCFFSSLEAVLGIAGVSHDLQSYTESTDGGIAREAIRRAFGRDAATEELERLREVYLAKLKEAVVHSAPGYRPIPGADRVFEALEHDGRWEIAIATGNWRGAAAVKLACAGIAKPTNLAGSEDGLTRADVVVAARNKAGQNSGHARRVVYVGDQPWDLHAAQSVGAGFLGVGEGAGARRFADRGARTIANYSDSKAFVALLDEVGATTPPWSP